MISIGSNILLWKLKSMDNKNPDKSELKSLKKKVNSFMKVLQELLLTANAMTLCEVGAYSLQLCRTTESMTFRKCYSCIHVHST